LNIFELFALLDGQGKHVEALHWLMNSIEETTRPVKSTSNWGRIRADGRALINTFYKNLTLLKDRLGSLKVSLEQFEQCYLLALKLIKNDGPVQEALK